MKIVNPTQFRNNMRDRFDTFIENKTKSTNLEIGVYNYALKEATNRKVVRKWDNEHFVQLYVDRLRTIYMKACFLLNFLVLHISHPMKLGSKNLS